MDFLRIKAILQKIQNVSIAIYGDFCIDAYWILDPHGSEISVEYDDGGKIGTNYS